MHVTSFWELFDRKVTYDGFLNTYTFSKDGKKITLAPLSPSQIQKRKAPNTKPQSGLILTSDTSIVKAPPYAPKASKEKTLSSLAWVNDLSYKVHTTRGLKVSANLNMADLSPYVEDDQKSNLRANSSQQGEYDGDGPMVPYHEPQGIPRGPRKRPKVKEKERNMNNQLSILPGQTFSHEPGFIKLMEDDLGGIISVRHALLKLRFQAFQQDRLQLIWSSFGRPNSPKTEGIYLPVPIQHSRKVKLLLAATCNLLIQP